MSDTSLFTQVQNAVQYAINNTSSDQQNNYSERIADFRTVSQVLQTTDDFIANSNQFENIASSAIGLESISSGTKRVGGPTAVSTDRANDVINFVNECIPEFALLEPSHPNVTAMVTRIMTTLHGGVESYGEHVSETRAGLAEENVGNIIKSLMDITGRGAIDEFMTSNEAFGVNADNIQADARLSVAIIVLGHYKSITDRMFNRIAKGAPTVVTKIARAEVYDLAKAGAADSETRFSGSHRKPILALQRDPSLVNTKGKSVIPLKANDVTGKNVLLSDGILLVDKQANLFDLHLTQNLIGSTHVDNTDQIGEGGTVSSIIVEVGDTKTGASEQFRIPVNSGNNARFIASGNDDDSFARSITGFDKRDVSLTQGVMTIEDTPSSIFDFTEWKDNFVRLEFSGNWNLNLKSGDISGQVMVISPKAIKIVNGEVSAANSAAVVKMADLSIKVIAYETDLVFSEENMRKTTLAAQMRTSSYQIDIPPGRNIVVQASMHEAEPKDVIGTLAEMNALGNATRQLAIVHSQMDEVVSAIKNEGALGGYRRGIGSKFVGGSKAIPTVRYSKLSLLDGNVKVRRHAERLVDIQSKIEYFIQSEIAELLTRSLHSINLTPGEDTVFKVYANKRIVDMLFSGRHFNSNLKSAGTAEAKKRAGADQTILLANGVRLDIYATHFISAGNSITGTISRDNIIGDYTSFGVIYDNGTYTGNYTDIGNGGVHRRWLANSREILDVTCPIAFKIDIEDAFGPNGVLENLDKDLK